MIFYTFWAKARLSLLWVVPKEFLYKQERNNIFIGFSGNKIYKDFWFTQIHEFHVTTSVNNFFLCFAFWIQGQ